MSKNTNQNGQKSDLTDVGAFWKKTKNGKTFLSGKVKIGDNEYTAFIFANNKTKPNQPDYRLTLSELDEQFKPQSQQAAPKKAKQEDTDEVSENQDDIPF